MHLLDWSHVAGVSHRPRTQKRLTVSPLASAYGTHVASQLPLCNFALYQRVLTSQGSILSALRATSQMRTSSIRPDQSARVKIGTTIRVESAVAYCCGGPDSGVGSQGGVSMRRFSVRRIFPLITQATNNSYTLPANRSFCNQIVTRARSPETTT